MQRKERIQRQKNGHSKLEQKKKKNKAGKTTTNIFSNREQYLLATYADNNISLQQRAIEQQ